MNMKKNISIMAFAAAAMLCCGCSDWTTPENLNFHPQTPEQKDPAAYAEYINAVKAFKETEHNVMIVTMEGTSQYPSSQSQHIMAMPDSADYVCVKIEDKLHEVIAAEIPAVLEKKGTKSLVYVDYAVIAEAWTALEDERADKGEAPGTDEQLAAFFKEQADIQLARCNEYGFAGVMVSFQGTKVAGYAYNSQNAYMQAVKAFHEANPEKELVFRGVSWKASSLTSAAPTLIRTLRTGSLKSSEKQWNASRKNRNGSTATTVMQRYRSKIPCPMHAASACHCTAYLPS